MAGSSNRTRYQRLCEDGSDWLDCDPKGKTIAFRWGHNREELGACVRPNTAKAVETKLRQLGGRLANGALYSDVERGAKIDPHAVYAPFHALPRRPTSIDRLSFALRSHDRDEVERLLAGTPLDRRDWLDSYPLYHAARFGHLEVVRTMIARGAPLDAISGESKATALHAACENALLDVVRVLVEAGADHALRDANGHGVFRRDHHGTRAEEALSRARFLRPRDKRLHATRDALDRYLLDAGATLFAGEAVEMLDGLSADRRRLVTLLAASPAMLDGELYGRVLLRGAQSDVRKVIASITQLAVEQPRATAVAILDGAIAAMIEDDDGRDNVGRRVEELDHLAPLAKKAGRASKASIDALRELGRAALAQELERDELEPLVALGALLGENVVTVASEASAARTRARRGSARTTRPGR